VMRRIEGGQFAGCPPEIFDFLLECGGTNPIRAAARRTLIIDKIDLRPILPTIPHPILMIGGDRDGLVPRAMEAEVETGAPNVRRIEFSPCGHYPQYTMPDPMTAAMVPFLRG
jgi:pimeloyl-ACP methyl ester carboxylesterase